MSSGSKIGGQLRFIKQIKPHLFWNSESVWAFANTQMLWKKSVYNWHLYFSKYFSRELNSKQVQALPCGSECQGVTQCPVSWDLFLCSARGTGVICNRTNSCFVQGKAVRGEGRKQQAYIKHSLGSEPLPRGDKEK